MNLFSGLEKFGLEAKESMQLFEEGKRENTKKEKEEEKKSEGTLNPFGNRISFTENSTL